MKRSGIPAFLAGATGWTLDAFDFFLVVLCLTAIGRESHQSDAAMSLAIVTTLAFRPVGGFLFGLLAALCYPLVFPGHGWRPPGFGNACGVVLASRVVYLEAVFARHSSYATAMAATAVIVLAGAILMTAAGNEKKAAKFGTMP